MKKNYVRPPQGILRLNLELSGVRYHLIACSDRVGLRKAKVNPPFTEARCEKYFIQKGKCSCPAFQNYFGECKHVKAMRKLQNVLELAF